jgi:peroxiredoxin
MSAINHDESGADVEAGDISKRLVGEAVPTLTLESTKGSVNIRELAENPLVLFLYPHATGLPDVPVPGWERIPGAMGCTAESCAFRDLRSAFDAIGATVAGLSVQESVEQRAFADRIGIEYRLISDPTQQLAAVLDLPTFTASGRRFYKRVTLVAKDRRIIKVFYPIPQPEMHAADVLAWLSEAPHSS